MDSIEIKHFVEPNLPSGMGAQLLELFKICFPKSKNLTKRRFNNEMPAERWIAYSEGKAIGHLAIHHKFITDENKRELPFIGIAEVCLTPEFRKKGLVGSLLRMADELHRDKDFSILFGESSVYQKYGYANVSNVECPDIPTISHLMAKCLSCKTWPSGTLSIPGQYF
jgi:predicted acetyltransferase